MRLFPKVLRAAHVRSRSCILWNAITESVQRERSAIVTLSPDLYAPYRIFIFRRVIKALLTYEHIYTFVLPKVRIIIFKRG